ncbi:MAG TPA: aminotransferase class V-fold PLP-dependent enzyme [Micromonosporaceae bacterium]
MADGQFADVERIYLDTASYGIPPKATVEALQLALHGWSTATADWIMDWDGAGDTCRSLIAPMLGAPEDEIALLPAASVGAAIALTWLPPGAEVVAPTDEFASILLPALVAAEQRGATVRRVEFDALPESLTAGTALVLSSHVRSNDGRVQDLAALGGAAKRVGARVLLDATHSAGILPIDAVRHGIDYVVAAAYKHLLCPRGVAFLRVPANRFADTDPIAASWRSAKAPYDFYYGPSLADLAPTAARYDVSLAWHPWFGAAASLAFLAKVPATERRDWCVGLADELAKRLDVPSTGSSVLSVPLRDGDRARAELRERRIVGSGRGDRLRLSFHLYNDIDDVAAAAEVLGRHVA